MVTEMEIDVNYLKFKHPSNMLVCGMTGSGKTQLIRRIIKNYKIIFQNDFPERIKVLWAYGQWTNFIDVKFNNLDVIYVNGLPNESLLEQHRPNIVIIDDLMNEMNKDKTFENIFIKKSHHLNISVIFSVQNMFYNSKSMRTISLNCHYIILMKNPRDKSQIFHLGRQIFPHDMKYLIEAYKDATNSPYGYLKIDLTPETPEHFRLQTRITPEELSNTNSIFSPILYLPLNVEKS